MIRTPIPMFMVLTAFICMASAKRADPVFRFFALRTAASVTPEEFHAALPRTFSATGFFSDIAAKTVGPGAYAFDINSPLWSDGAGKSRYLILPKDSMITYLNDSDEFRFPEGAVFVKHFWIDTVENRPDTRMYIETRLLIRQEGEWHGLGYKWRKDQSDADLNGGPYDTAALDSFSVTTAAGTRRMKKWVHPSRKGFSFRNMILTSCNSCHLNRATGRQRSILGFITPQLTLAANGKDQIRDLMEKGYMVSLQGARYAAATAHRWYALDDSTAPGSTLEKRARSYLASNCSHCHSPGGAASCIPVYTFNTPHDSMNYVNPKSVGAWGLDESAGDSAKWIYPGKPELSTLLRRISAADPDGYRESDLYFAPGIRLTPMLQSAAPRPLAKRAGWDGNGLVQMPPIATFEPNPLADRIIRDWIKSLPAGYTGAGAAIGRHARSMRAVSAAGSIQVRNGLILVSGASPRADGAGLSDVRGRTIPLAAARPGAFLIPADLEEGVYLFHLGGKRWPLTYFR